MAYPHIAARSTTRFAKARLGMLVRAFGWASAAFTSAGMAAPAQAQSFIPPVVATAQTTLLSGASSANPGQVAVDKAGNVFFINHNSPVTLYEIPAASPAANNNAPIALITGLGQYNSNGLFVDPKGNLWVANGNGTATVNNATAYIGFVEIPAGTNGIPNTSGLSSTTVQTFAGTNCSTSSTTVCVWPANTFAVNITSYYSQPSTLTGDAAGNIVFYDYNSSKIISFNTATPGTGTLLATAPTANNQASVAIDGAGAVYYCDDSSTNYGAKGTGKLSLVSGGSLTTVGTTAALGSAVITSCIGVAADLYGNLFVHGLNSSSAQQISEIPFEGNALNFSDEFGIISSTANNGANGLTSTPAYPGALDRNGNFVFATTSGVVELQINGYNFGNVPVGTLVTPSSSVPAPALNLYANASLSNVSSYFPTGSPVTNTTAPYLQSFPYSGTKTFSGGSSFSTGSNYSITMDFQPVHPGLALGSYTPRSNGSDLAVVNLQGNGVGPLALSLPGTPSQLFNVAAVSTTKGAAPRGLNGPTGLAVDSYGDVFVADTGNGKVVADCLPTTTQNEDGTGGSTSNTFCSTSGYSGNVVQLGTNFVSPVAIALDGAMSLYVLDSAATAAPVTLINGQTLTSSPLVPAGATFGGATLSGPMGLAIDGYTNLYIADTGNNRIVQAHTFGASATDNIVYVPSGTLFGGTRLSGPTGLAVDASQNLFIADTGNNRIVEFSATGVSSVISTNGITLTSPYAVAVYPSGALLIADKANGLVLVNNGSASVLSFGNAYTTTGARGVAIDAFGNIYLGNTTGNQVLELNTSAAPTLPLPSTNAGAASPDTTLVVTNLGNAALTHSAVSLSSTNFTLSSANTCTATASETPGASCNLVARFTPSTSSSGTVSSTATITDNQLSYTLNTSTPNETGTFATSGSFVANLSGTATTNKTPQTITFAPVTTPVTYGMVTSENLSATGGASSNPVTFSVLSGPGTISGSTLTITGAGSIVVAADQAGNSTYAPAQEVTQTVVVNKAPQVITFAPLSTPLAYTSTPISLSATGGASSSSVTYSVLSGPGSLTGNQLTVTGVGTVVVAADQAGDANYSAAPEVTQSVVVTQAPQTITFPQPAAVTFPSTVALTATSSSSLAVTYKVISGAASVSGSTLTPANYGNVVVEADQAGNANYTAASAVQRTITFNPVGTVAPVALVDNSGNPVVAGTYNVSHYPTIYLTDSTPGATIYFTVDGSTPTASSPVFNSKNYPNGIGISQTTTVNAIALLNGYVPSTISTATYTINTSAEGLQYTLTPTALTLKTGQSGTIAITVTPQNGTNAAISFSCSGLPIGATCSFSPATLQTVPAQTTVSTTLTVTAPTTLATLERRSPTNAAPGVFLALTLGCIGLRRKRRAFAAAGLFVVALAALPLLSGCGSSSPNSQTSTVTVAIAGDAVRVSPTFTLTVTK